MYATVHPQRTENDAKNYQKIQKMLPIIAKFDFVGYITLPLTYGQVVTDSLFSGLLQSGLQTCDGLCRSG